MRQPRGLTEGAASFQMTFTVKVTWGSHSLHTDLRALRGRQGTRWRVDRNLAAL